MSGVKIRMHQTNTPDEHQTTQRQPGRGAPGQPAVEGCEDQGEAVANERTLQFATLTGGGGGIPVA